MKTLIEKLEIREKELCRYAQNESDDTRRLCLNSQAIEIQKAIDIVKNHKSEVCNWQDNKGTDAWTEWSDCGDYSSDCGLEWHMFNNQSPNENYMNFCPKCGKKLVEIQPPSEMQDD